MKPRISWELTTDSLGSVEHTLGNAGRGAILRRRNVAVISITYSLMLIYFDRVL